MSIESQQTNKENENVHVPATSPDPGVVFVTPQTHYHHSCQQPQFPIQYPPFGMNQFSSPFSSNAEHPYGVGYSFQSHMNAPFPPSQTQSLRTSVTKKKGKGKNPSPIQSSNPPRRLWTPAEDIALTKAYLYVSVDSNVGKDHTSERMWNRILVAWRENMGTYDESRKANGLSFHRAPKSGVSIENLKRDTLRLYKETGDGSAFKFEHCWEILKENPKWCSLQLTKTGTSKKEKKTAGEGLADSLAQTSLTSSLPDGVTDVDKEDIDAEQGVARPPGKNTSKAKHQKAHEQKNIAGILSKSHLYMIILACSTKSSGVHPPKHES
ncbi:hypothetical protein C5167_000784 [Papaver somniferum]|uniref:No apical meristem-associated C-terminal domain-containing protein n=1 Tax=Papaver somniferum TaxID=3469 RepID=A0A4Y7KTH2_PAPSO|nr:hypothetical protein C5167_000784 [Papaver somniferum]